MRFVAECVAGALLLLGGSWVVGKVGSKINSKANADIRSAAALERIAAAAERAYPPPETGPEKISVESMDCRDEKGIRQSCGFVNELRQ
jgi:hypothetical protein